MNIRMKCTNQFWKATLREFPKQEDWEVCIEQLELYSETREIEDEKSVDKGRHGHVQKNT